MDLWTGKVALQTCSDWRPKWREQMMIAVTFIILLGYREALSAYGQTPA